MSRMFLIGLLLSFAGGLLLAKLFSSPREDAPKFHKYDVNQDGAVTPMDALLITNYLNDRLKQVNATENHSLPDKITRKDLNNIIDLQGKIVVNQIKLLQNQAIISIGQLRLHHFIEPHSDFYPMCPECQKDKKEILDNRNKTTKYPRQDSNLQPTD